MSSAWWEKNSRLSRTTIPEFSAFLRAFVMHKWLPRRGLGMVRPGGRVSKRCEQGCAGFCDDPHIDCAACTWSLLAPRIAGIGGSRQCTLTRNAPSSRGIASWAWTSRQTKPRDLRIPRCSERLPNPTHLLPKTANRCMTVGHA